MPLSQDRNACSFSFGPTGGFFLNEDADTRPPRHPWQAGFVAIRLTGLLAQIGTLDRRKSRSIRRRLEPGTSMH